jgi:hypothetical protein
MLNAGFGLHFSFFGHPGNSNASRQFNAKNHLRSSFPENLVSIPIIENTRTASMDEYSARIVQVSSAHFHYT